MIFTKILPEDLEKKIDEHIDLYNAAKTHDQQHEERMMIEHYCKIYEGVTGTSYENHKPLMKLPPE